jgi:hypothetical protein
MRVQIGRAKGVPPVGFHPQHTLGTAFGRYWHGIGTARHDTGPERLA